MSENIPGGRQRSSSDGDILEEGISCGFKSSKSSGNVKEVANSINNKQPGRLRVFTKHRNKTSTLPLPTTLSDHPECDENVFDSDGGLSSQGSLGSNKSKKRSRKLSFKSMRKAVSRAFVKEGKGATGEQNGKSNPFTVEVNDSGKIWTPDLRHLGKGQSNMYDTDSPRSILSSSRPLITDPDLGMTIPKWKRTPGTIGIFNHANSCFMNAVLQCLSNTDSFTEYFVQEFHKHDLKLSKNARKTTFRTSHGEVTEQLGQLLSSLWCGKYQSDISKAFKAAVAKMNNQYQGDDQHDAQEFLLWLLDRVHEDVCLPLKKKLKNQKSSTPKSDEELAQEALSVNGDSFVVKLFKALHSSTLTCPSCGDRSQTFDPYLCVSLPLPQRSPRLMFINIVFLEPHGGYRCIKIGLVVNHFDTVQELRESISTEAGIPVSQIILCQLTKEGFGATYSNEQPLSDIADNDMIYALETHSDGRGVADNNQTDNQFDSPIAQVLVIHVEKTDKSSQSRRFGLPSVIEVSRDIRWKDLQKEMLYQLGDAVFEEIHSQRLSNLFMMQVWDGSSQNGHLSMDVEMPLYTQAAERALDTLSEDFGPLHIKILSIWNTQTKNKVFVDDRERITEHSSVRELSSNPPSLDTVSLYECFKLYTQEEKLIGEDAWMCPHCKQLQQGTVKSLGLWSLPDILILHLKRFKQTGRSKLNTLVEFPIDDFDMSPHLSPGNKSTSHVKSDNSTYDLVGVCNHYGNMMGGHYTAFCRSPVDGKWREFNDTKVREVDGPVATKEAYLLFYQRRSLSKDINQKLFTGDHWVFSLPLSQQEEKESPSSPDKSPREEKEISQSTFRVHKTRSRSTSPSLRRRQSGSPTKRVPLQPSTPQPKRKPAVLSYYDNNDEDNDDDRENEYNREEEFNDVHTSAQSSPEKLRHPSQPQQHTVRQSRPLQRQLSSPSDVARRIKSLGKSPTRGVFERRNDAEDATYAPSKMPTKHISYQENSLSAPDKSKNHLVVSVIRHPTKENGIEPSSGSNGLKYRNDNRNGFQYVGSSSTTTIPTSPFSSQKDALDNYELRNNGVHDETRLDSGAKYPTSLSSSSHIPSCHITSDKYSNNEIRSGHSSHSDTHNNKYNKDDFVSGLQVNLDMYNSRHNHLSSSQVSKSNDFESTLPSSSSGEARRRLAEHIKQNSFEKDIRHEYPTTTTRPTSNTSSGKYQSQNSYDRAQRNPVDFTTLLDNSGNKYRLRHDLAKRSPLNLEHLSIIDDHEFAALSDLDVRGHDLHDDSNPPLKSYRSEDYGSHKDRQSYPPRIGDEDYLLYSNDTYQESSLQSRLKEDELRQLAQKHFGEPSPGVPSFSDPPIMGESSKSSTLYQKYATIARSREISPSSHYPSHHHNNHNHPYHNFYHHNDSGDLLLSSSSTSMSVPRSITDQNISYNNYNNPSELPTLLEENGRGFDSRRDSPSSSSSRLTEREINLIRSYDKGSWRVPSSLTGTRLTSSYGTRRFMRPRGWGISPPKTSKLPTSNVPAPCLRESSV